MNLDWLLCYWLFSSAEFVGVLELHLVGVFNYLDLTITGQFTGSFLDVHVNICLQFIVVVLLNILCMKSSILKFNFHVASQYLLLVLLASISAVSSTCFLLGSEQEEINVKFEILTVYRIVVL